MIYIIDNGEPPMDHSLYFIKVSSEEAEIFGDTLEPILLEMLDYNPDAFIAGIADHVRWFKEFSEVQSFQSFVYIFRLLQEDENRFIIKRRKKIPPLPEKAIDYLIDCHIQDFPKDKSAFRITHDNISWDEIRKMLSEACHG